MFYTEFPDLQWVKTQAEEGFLSRKAWGGQTLTNAGWPSVILNVKTGSIYRDNIRGPLSIFTNLSGKSTVSCGKEITSVPQGFFYTTNQDQRYTLEVENSAETFNIHFGEYWADQVLRSLVTSPGRLLDEAYFTVPFERIELYNRLHHRDHHFDNMIADLRNENDGMREEERLYDMLVYLLAKDSDVRKKARAIPALKKSTRDELVKRLLITTDYIYSLYDKDISLDELARVSCLSKFHFLRLFKIVFGKTPHQFINEVKVLQSRHLLKDPKIEVKAIARSLGFKDASTFSRMFYQQTGFYPSQLRG